MDLAEHLVYLAPVAGFLALLFAAWRAVWVARQDTGTGAMVDLAGRIRTGSMAFLRAEVRYLAIFALLVAGVLAVANLVGDEGSAWIVLSFAAGGVASALAGWLAVRAATKANVRTAQAATTSLPRALSIAFAGGSVIGMTAVGLGLVALALLWLGYTEIVFAEGTVFERATLAANVLTGFALGASSIALFARVGGGIYAKAADAGARLADDELAKVANRVGDHVGRVAGASADLFESHAAALIAAIVLGLGFTASEGGHVGPIVLPLALAGAGVLCSIAGTFFVRAKEGRSAQSSLEAGAVGAALPFAALTFGIAWLAWPEHGTRIAGAAADPVTWLDVATSAFVGVAAGVAIGAVLAHFRGKRSEPNVLASLGSGMQSTATPIVLIAIAVIIAVNFAGLYGIAIAALGMLGTMGIQLAALTSAPIARNAGGIAAEAEKLELEPTESVGRGVAIGSAAMTALALFAAFARQAGIDGIDATSPKVMAGILVGGVLPFLFSSLAVRAASEAASDLVDEVRRQLAGDNGKTSADTARCIDVASRAALRRMILPGALAIAVPVLVGAALGAEALGGLLAGAIACGTLLAMFLSSAGGAWERAKRALGAGETDGDPFEDTAGLNVLVKLMGVVALVIAPFLAG